MGHGGHQGRVGAGGGLEGGTFSSPVLCLRDLRDVRVLQIASNQPKGFDSEWRMLWAGMLAVSH